jgi:hypothetical protein
MQLRSVASILWRDGESATTMTIQLFEAKVADSAHIFPITFNTNASFDIFLELSFMIYGQ